MRDLRIGGLGVARFLNADALGTSFTDLHGFKNVYFLFGCLLEPVVGEGGEVAHINYAISISRRGDVSN
jgi:hypothetical protein